MSETDELQVEPTTVDIDEDPDIEVDDGEASAESADRYSFTDAFVDEALEGFDVLADLEDYETWETPDEEELRGAFYDLAAIDGQAEVKATYWLDAPFSFAVITFDGRAREHVYHIVEPALDEFEEYVRDDLTDHLKNILLYVEMSKDDRRWEDFRDVMHDVLTDYSGDLGDSSIYKLHYYLKRDFVEHGKIEPLLNDRHVEDISCDGTAIPVWIYHNQFEDLKTNVSFDTDHELNSYIQRLSERSGKHISVSNPLVDTSLVDGSRVQLTMGRDIGTRGSNFTIRKFADTPITPVDLVDWGTFSAEEMAYFWLAIENNKSLVFAGGTGSGKTTSMNAVSFFIPPGSKVVSIEDTREVTLPHENWVASVTRESFAEGERGGVDMYDLLQSALRQRPEYLIVGEIRAQRDVAQTFFQALATGHTAYTTFHADSAEELINRMENDPLSVPSRMVQGLDIVSVQRQVRAGERRYRRNNSVDEIRSVEGRTDAETVFSWDPKEDAHEKVAESPLMQEIRDENGWDDGDLDRELGDRIRLIDHLVGSEIRDYMDVGATLHMFKRDRDYVMDGVEDDALDPAEFR